MNAAARLYSKQMRGSEHVKVFDSEKAKQEFLRSYEWKSLLYGYGAHIIEQTETTLKYRASDTCD
jgi:hypothetical protein